MTATADDYLVAHERAKAKRLLETPDLTNYPTDLETRIIDRMVVTPLGASKGLLMDAYRIWLALDDDERKKAFKALRGGA